MLKDPALEESKLRLNFLGQIIGKCKGSFLRQEGAHVDSIQASYAPSSRIITGLTFNINGDQAIIGRMDRDGVDSEITEWTFTDEIKFIGI